MYRIEIEPLTVPPVAVSGTAGAELAGRMYLGKVRWFDDQADRGVVTCREPRVGDVPVTGSDICNVDVQRLSAGQELCFFLQLTPSGLRATNALILSAP
jgi:cold shock CspA family protein